jgi:hypothetical protein
MLLSNAATIDIRNHETSSVRHGCCERTMKGNGPAQRAVIAAAEGIEDEPARATAEQGARETQTTS